MLLRRRYIYQFPRDSGDFYFIFHLFILSDSEELKFCFCFSVQFPEVIGPVLQGMEGLAERSITVYEALYDKKDTSENYSKLEVSV
jgi:hypothetical protein